MCYERHADQEIKFQNQREPTAKKEHICCECQKTIKVGEKYSSFAGVWRDFDGCNFFRSYKTCLDCERIRKEILKIFGDNGFEGDLYVFGSLREAIQDAFEEGFLTRGNPLISEWPGIKPEDIEDFSPEEKEDYQRRKAVAQMRSVSSVLL